MAAEPDATPTTTVQGRRHHRARRRAARARLRGVVAWVLAVACALLVPLTVTAHWVSTTLENSDRYVATMAPLAQDRGFTDELAGKVTDVLFDDLPTGLRQSTAARRLHAPVERAVAKTMTTPAFQRIWNRANRAAHATALKVLTGQGDAAVGTNGALVVNLTPLVQPLLAQLQKSGIHLFDKVSAGLVLHHQVTVTLLTATQLREARHLFGLLVHAEWPLGIAALATAAGALLASTRRWRLLVGGALCTAAAVGLFFGGLTVARNLVVDRAAGTGVDPPVAGQVFDILVRYLRADLLTTLLAAGDVAALGAALWGLWWVLHRDGPHAAGRSSRRARPGPTPPASQTGRSATASSSATTAAPVSSS